MATNPMFIGTLNNEAVTFVNADGTTAKDLWPPANVAGTAGFKVLDLNAVSDDTATVQVDIWLHDGTTAFLLGRVPVVTLSGTDGTAPSVSLLDPTLLAGALDADGQLTVPDGWKLQVAPSAAITAAKTLTIIGIGGEY
ncbi:MAG: hypothetical protein ACC726_03690 [Chloroflexota bacterium]